ncbi:DotU family type IV/VI secretion system protein [Marinospirillum sp.]|uniref:DotU family type IV/VI secretion system protein n=1 Tax=Marinospirillum sp. TaxID=2183934 RepID=UPI00287081A2|nr:DotU family type IV/VI secretion system protein [Marinospirillum sp.]MDR9467445.1 DotU family type IV/VI secretion system protein [Marinospirillum sp.]
MRMIDCFIEVLAYVKQVEEQVSSAGIQPGLDEVHTECERLLADKALVYASLGYRREHYEKARFAVVAFIDETLMASGWQEAEAWGAHQLQKKYYDTANAGQEFFQQLDTLTLIDPADQDVREVFYYCLALGFKGRFFSPSEQAHLERLRMENFELLSQGQKQPWDSEAAILTPEAYPVAPETTPRHRKFSYLPLYLGGPLLVVLVAYGLMRMEVVALAQRLVALI